MAGKPTYPIISSKVGKGGITSGVQVRKIQQLLYLVGVYKGAITATWSQTEAAWVEFQKSLRLSPKTHVDPIDPEDRLAELASAADVLAYLPSGLCGRAAALYLVDYFIRLQLPYGHQANTGGTRKIWGFEGRREMIIFGLPGEGEFPVDGRPTCSVNCTSFANAVLGAWHLGLHQWPYDSSQDVGGDKPQLGERYMMPEILNANGKRGHTDLAYLKTRLQPNRIYHVSICETKTSLSTKHDMILLDGMIYQANVKQVSTEAGAVYRLTLDEQWRRTPSKHLRVLGPSAI